MNIFRSVFHYFIVYALRWFDKPCRICLLFSFARSMELSQEQVRHIAKLARLGLSDDEVKKFSTQLTNILQYVEILSEVDTSSVEATNQVTGLKNVMREDAVNGDWTTRDELLGCSELPVERDQIRVKPAIE